MLAKKLTERDPVLCRIKRGTRMDLMAVARGMRSKGNLFSVEVLLVVPECTFCSNRPQGEKVEERGKISASLLVVLYAHF